jgi:hypothetical protein
MKKKTTKTDKGLRVEKLDINDTQPGERADRRDRYGEHGCDTLNEAECEEELDEDGLELDEVEKEHFDEKDQE